MEHKIIPPVSWEHVLRRVQNAEKHAIHFSDGAVKWWKYYEDDEKNKSFINDFYYLIHLCGNLGSENTELRYHLEAAGVNVEDKLKEGIGA